MGFGSVLVGIAVTIVVGAYVALPFRKTRGDPDKVAETWVGQVRATGVAPRYTEGRTRRRHRARPGSEAAPQYAEAAPQYAEAAPQYAEAEAINFCPQCGRRAGPDDRFCAGCGKQLREGSA